MLSFGNDELWLLYREALRRALVAPDFDGFMMAANAMPLSLYTQTDPVIPSVPEREALAQVFRFGNVLPRWSPVYRPTADGDLLSLYREFTASIKRQNDPPVQRAVQRLEQLDRELAAGQGELVMSTATDAGAATVARFESSPLGSPGYSAWLKDAIATFGKLPPQVDVTVSSRTPRPPARATAFGRLREDDLPAFVSAAGAGTPEIVSLRLMIHAITSLAVMAGPWFEASLLAVYTQPSDFKPGSVFATRPIWGPAGTFNVIPTSLAAAFRPVVEVTFERPEPTAVRSLRLGPFRLVPHEDQSRLAAEQRRYRDLSLGPLLLGVACARPNAPLARS